MYFRRNICKNLIIKIIKVNTGRVLLGSSPFDPHLRLRYVAALLTNVFIILNNIHTY